MVKWMQEHWKLSLIIFIVLAVVFITTGVIRQRASAIGKPGADPTEPTSTTKPHSNSEDSIIMRKQADLIKAYGPLPEGYLWDIDGTLLSQGDKSLSAEEVVYAYLNGIKSLDFSMAQKYSRGSRVVDIYGGYFDSKDPNTDYADQFYRNMYRQALLSIKVVGIESNSIFAENKQVFSVRVEMLDLTHKTFWEEDKEFIYSSLLVYNNEDSTKAEIFLYDYILDYYKSPNPVTREVTFDLTLEKYPDLDTGWLVSIDTDVDNACRYSDGTPVIRYIREMYNEEGRRYLENLELQRQEATSPEEVPVA